MRSRAAPWAAERSNTYRAHGRDRIRETLPSVASELRPSCVKELPSRFGVSTLPDTYLVEPAGRVVERDHGARDGVRTRRASTSLRG